MGTNHTPGPWHRNIKPARIYPTVWAGRNTHVAVVVRGAPRGSGAETMSDEELEANINLIVAAPEILNVVREACAIFDMNREGDEYNEYNDDLASDLWKNEIHEKLIAAIAKATGAP